MNRAYRTPLPGTALDYFDVRAAIDAIRPGAYDGLPYVARVLAEQVARGQGQTIVIENRPGAGTIISSVLASALRKAMRRLGRSASRSGLITAR